MKYPETARRLRKAMNDKKINAAELAERSGVGKSSISHYYNGSNRPTNLNAGALAEVLEVNPMWLMGFDVPKEPENPLEKYKGMLVGVDVHNKDFVMEMADISKDMTMKDMAQIANSHCRTKFIHFSIRSKTI